MTIKLFAKFEQTFKIVKMNIFPLDLSDQYNIQTNDDEFIELSCKHLALNLADAFKWLPTMKVWLKSLLTLEHKHSNKVAAIRFNYGKYQNNPVICEFWKEHAIMKQVYT